MEKEKKPFLFSIHHFRAFAIVNVMFVHLWTVPDGTVDPSAAQLIVALRELLFHDSTIYFLFISGFLFYYLSENFSAKRYYISKVSYVLSPYLLFTLVLSFHSGWSLIHWGKVVPFLSLLLNNVMLGKAEYQYWYIPLVSVLIILGPLLLKVPKEKFKALALVASILPLLGTRTGRDISLGQLCYFSPVYILGMFTAMFFSETLIFVGKIKYILVFLTALSAILTAVAFGHSKVGFFNIYEAFQYVNKICVTYLVLLFLTNHENYRSKVLDTLASFSFALYFSHMLVHNNMSRLLYSTVGKVAPILLSTSLIIPLTLFFAVCSILVSLLFCIGLKRLLGKYSRYFIGA